MKNTVRVHNNRGTKPASVQSQSIREKTARADDASLFIPSEAARQACDALANLENVGHAAIALAMMNAEEMKEAVDAFDGWQALEVHGFREGALALAQTICTSFNFELSDCANGLRTIAAKIKDHHQPIAPTDTSVEDFKLVEAHYKNNKLWKQEDAVNSLRHLLRSQGSILSGKSNSQIAHTTSFAIEEKLQSAFEMLMDAQNKVHRAFLAIVSATAAKEVAV